MTCIANCAVHFRRAPDGVTRRFCGLAPEREAMLGIAPVTRQGSLLASLQPNAGGEPGPVAEPRSWSFGREVSRLLPCGDGRHAA